MTEGGVTGTRSLESFLEGNTRPVSRPQAAVDDGVGPAAGCTGEVIESSTTTLVAEARHLHEAPDFGAFVRVESDGRDIVGVVHNTRTQSIP